MRRSLLLLSAFMFVSLGLIRAGQNPQENSGKADAKADDSKITAEDVARVNPVKASPEGLAEARKMFGYDCAMCHGDKGDGKGDVVESMKLTMHDWREPATLAKMSDGEIFSIITKGKGKMTAEGDRMAEKLRWNLVNLVRAMAAKGGGEQKSAAATPAQ